MHGQLLTGRYLILSDLGKGGFGQTYLAEDTQRPGHPRCVVKQLKPYSTEPSTLETARRLFYQEAVVLELLGNHDRVPRLLAYFEENNEFYLVEELIEGINLNDELNPPLPLNSEETVMKRFTESYVVEFLRDLLEVLVFIQQHNVIHRDIKPSNLIRRASDGKIVLIDFGAVKQIRTQIESKNQGSPKIQATITRSIVIGTLGYMPQEQLAGNPNFSSDLFAVGAIAIQALTGMQLRYFPQDSQGEFIWRDRAEVPDRLANILEKMVRFNCRDRAQSAAEVLQELFPPSSPPIPEKLPEKKLSKKLVLGMSVVILLGGIIIFYLIPKPDKLLTYQNPNYGITLKYPAQWEIKQDPILGEVARFVSPKENPSDQFQESLSITVEPLETPNMSLEKYTEATVNSISKELTKDIISPISIKLENQEAKQVIYTQKEGDIKIKTLQIWTIKNNRVYVITFKAEFTKYSEFEKTAKTMIESLKIQ
jgi:eukaryotic-like serine/threonine-protein kinase